MELPNDGARGRHLAGQGAAPVGGKRDQATSCLALAIAIWRAYGAGWRPGDRLKPPAGRPSALLPMSRAISLGSTSCPTTIAVGRRVGLTDPAAAAQAAR